MKIGKMDRRVVFSTRDTTRDLYGQVGPGYTTAATVWADVIHRGTPREKFVEMSVFPSASITLIIRDPRGTFTLDETMRCAFDGNNYDVVGFQEIGRGIGFRVYLERIKKTA